MNLSPCQPHLGADCSLMLVMVGTGESLRLSRVTIIQTRFLILIIYSTIIKDDTAAYLRGGVSPALCGSFIPLSPVIFTSTPRFGGEGSAITLEFKKKKNETEQQNLGGK